MAASVFIGISFDGVHCTGICGVPGGRCSGSAGSYNGPNPRVAIIARWTAQLRSRIASVEIDQEGQRKIRELDIQLASAYVQ